MSEPTRTSPIPTPILFFDGECGLCHRTVAWFQRHDRRGVMHFAPLQGKTFGDLPRPAPGDLSTAVLLDERGLWTESGAVLAGLRALGGGWAALGSTGRLVPRCLRDAIYRFVAKRRLGWFGPADLCDLAGDTSRLLP